MKAAHSLGGIAQWLQRNPTPHMCTPHPRLDSLKRGLEDLCAPRPVARATAATDGGACITVATSESKRVCTHSGKLLIGRRVCARVCAPKGALNVTLVMGTTFVSMKWFGVGQILRIRQRHACKRDHDLETEASQESVCR